MALTGHRPYQAVVADTVEIPAQMLSLSPPLVTGFAQFGRAIAELSFVGLAMTLVACNGAKAHGFLLGDCCKVPIFSS